MIGLGGALAIAGVVAAIAAVGVGYAASEMAEASRYAADKNAQATIKAAQEAAKANIEQARYDAHARMDESAKQLEAEKLFLEQERYFESRNQEEQMYYNRMMAEIDQSLIGGGYLSDDGSFFMDSSSEGSIYPESPYYYG